MNTKVESLKKLDRATRYRMILEKLKQYPNGLTARELAIMLGFYERNATAPRLNELVKKGIVKENGIRYDELTQRNVTIFMKVGELN